MTFPLFLEKLEAGLAHPLPGAAAQEFMAPRPRREWPKGFKPADVRHAAGLLVVYPLDGQPHLILTVRSDVVRHAGQVSLPGGVIEAGETVQQAALREAHEEVGLRTEAVRLLGPLTPIDITVSGFRLHPVVAALEDRPSLSPTDGEVARILHIGVDSLMNPAHHTRRTMTRDGSSFDVPLFTMSGAEIWGATAMVLAEFLALLGWKGPSAAI